MTSSVNLGTSYKSAVVNKEEMTLQEFKKAMMKQSSMTLEEFYRCIDKTYSMSVTVKQFKNQLKLYNNFELNPKKVKHLITIFDEDKGGTISLSEYYDALDAYDCRGEEVSPFNNDPLYVNFEHMALFKLVNILREKNIDTKRLFKMIDQSGDGKIDVLELKTVLKESVGNFHEKELHAIKKYFDIDNDGHIEENEFFSQMKKANN